MDIILKKTERIDDLQIKGLKIIQDKEGFCFGIDAVLLSNFTSIKNNSKVADLGTGTGIIPIIIAGKSKAKEIIGIEIQEEVANMAKRSVKLNNLQDRVKIINDDLKNIENILEVNTFHVVTSNPPYMHPQGLKNRNDKKAISRHEIMCNLEDVIKAASRLLMHHGKFYMVHRPVRLADIITLSRRYKLEPKVIQFIHPKVGKAPNLMLVQFTKAGKAELKILDPLYVYKEDGDYTDEIKEIYAKEDIGEV
ncbi:tRNA1(Val) (adenine(37)-N6)-methyltransferase [Tepidibacter formicigenes]|uniref:tRNA1Val (Adenine37-N6)-methyltransferase n=1 Tax=Tepidibacter formicigenes DSM 15518 TaxID=1123349 RepID=A0A1M6PPI0_9FIRM|nr:tRNA1(Val) (adenine(37)-N6)-methyltransferase [Tepidibacter formicigenes]SHK09811.1 tRNA1Val (adenine37-N6)-methyltransferase [Tepidibacter formicigenes DSM 15518]